MGDLASLTSSISIVLGVLTYFLTMMIEKARALLAEDVPGGPIARADLRKRLLIVLTASALPLLTAFGMLFYLCLPTIAVISHTSTLQLWNFDLPRTLFVFLEVAISACLIITLVFAILLVKKTQQCKPA